MVYAKIYDKPFVTTKELNRKMPAATRAWMAHVAAHEFSTSIDPETKEVTVIITEKKEK